MTRPAIVLVFAENRHDSDSLKEIIGQVRPDLARRVQVRPKPVSLQRTAGAAAVRSWLADLADAVRATERGGQPVAAVVVHRDGDAMDVRGAERLRLLDELQSASLPHPLAAVPVVTIESWWLHHPDATESIAPRAWRHRLPRTARETDRVPVPKSELVRRTRPSGREYVEADSPHIAQARAQKSGTVGSSRSFATFLDDVRALP